MALKAARTWRVSSSSTGKPAALISAKSPCDNGPASRPMRAIGVPWAANQAISACGSQAPLASFRILPCASTMHTLALSNDTSRPAYCSLLHGRPSMMRGAGETLPPLFNTISLRDDRQSPEILASTRARYPISGRLRRGPVRDRGLIWALPQRFLSQPPTLQQSPADQDQGASFLRKPAPIVDCTHVIRSPGD